MYVSFRCVIIIFHPSHFQKIACIIFFVFATRGPIWMRLFHSHISARHDVVLKSVGCVYPTHRFATFFLQMFCYSSLYLLPSTTDFLSGVDTVPRCLVLQGQQDLTYSAGRWSRATQGAESWLPREVQPAAEHKGCCCVLGFMLWLPDGCRPARFCSLEQN